MRIAFAVVASTVSLLAACSSATPPPAAAAQGPIPFETTTSVKELMGWMIDPSAGAIWSATGTEVTEEGEKEFAPTTDEAWNLLRTHAVTVAESGNLLMLDGRARDQGDWLKLSRAMTDKALAVLEAIEAKDKDGLFESGGNLYQSCTDCHALYLIPDHEAAKT